MWDKAVPPDDGIVAQVLSLLIFQQVSREEVTDWATAWYRNEAYHPEPYLRDALYPLMGADALDAPDIYLFGVEDFISWQSELLERRPANDGDGIAYVQERVVFHDTSNEFAIHDVYFDAQGQVVAITEDALSPCAGSVPELEAVLQQLLHDSADGARIVSGDLRYTHDPEDIKVWLAALQFPLINDPFETEE